MAIRMQQRRGTAEQWLLSDPVLSDGEIGIETDTNSFKVGDGVNSWTTLDYFTNSSGLAASLSDYALVADLGQPNGIATLDATGNVPAAQLANATLDLTGYATETYVDDSIAAIPATDLTGYATETYADSAASTAEANANTYTDTSIAAIPAPDFTGYATETYVDTSVAALVDSAPGTLDTLNELAAALGDDANFATTITTSISNKADLDSPAFTGTVDFSGAIVQGLEIPQPIHSFTMIG